MQGAYETKLAEVELEGSPYERGEKHGKVLKDQIQSFLQDNLAQINILRASPIDRVQLPHLVRPYAEMIAFHLPEIMDELRGLAIGAGISLEEAVMLQIRREIIGTAGLTLAGDCSCFGFHSPDQVVLGQTIDLNGEMTSLGQVFRIVAQNSSSPQILMYSFAGLLGYMGMNSRGLAVLINLVVSDGWKPGIPPYLMVRKFLECQTIEECITFAKGIPIASSRSFLLSDKSRQVILEITPRDQRVIEGEFLVHTNHYLHQDFRPLDRLNIFSRNSSFKRLALLQERLRDHCTDLDAIQSVFADHSLFPVGICAHNEQQLKLNQTVAAVVMYPQLLDFWALKGKACEGTFQLFTLKK
ncbi:MAG: C45 family autoproteolytic acyltransferase/hydrolase [Ginsengibacter sp.]